MNNLNRVPPAPSYIDRYNDIVNAKNDGDDKDCLLYIKTIV